MSTANRKARPARRNSLQRMLELERRYMMERLQSSGMATQAKTAGGKPIVPPPTRNVFATNPHPTIQAYRAVGHTQTDLPQGAKSHVLETAPRLPPLTIDTQVAKPIQEANAKMGAANLEDSMVKDLPLPDKLASKIVSFYIPTEEDEEDRKSICQSPSWEAYGRRKKEKTEEKKDSKKELKKDVKKDVKEQKKEKENDKAKKKQKEKEEKEKEKKEKEKKEKEKREKEKEKEKEEASKAAAVKKKRLSKTPPTSSAHAIDQANRLSRSGPSPSLEQSRPSSMVGPASPSRDENAQRRPRSRSSSISSLFRRPFESRRNSTDEISPVETGFIGGIKLEMERHAAMQKALDDQLKPSKEDEANIHPALRTGKPDTTAYLETAPSTSGGKPLDPQRRAYPPITRLTTTAKNRPPMTTSTSMPDAGAMQKWKAFVGMKSTAKQGPSEAKVAAIATGAANSVPAQKQQSPQATRTNDSVPEGPKLAKSHTAPQLALLHDVNDAQVNLLTPNIEEHTIKSKTQQMQIQIPRKEVRNQEMTIRTNHRISDVTLPKPSPPCSFVAPPEPPERSPKRASVQSLVDLAPTLNSPAERPASQSGGRQSGSSNASTSAGTLNGNHSSHPPPNSRFNASNTTYKVDGSNQRHSYSGSSARDSFGSGIEHFASSGVTLGKGSRPESTKVTTWEDIKSSVAQAIADNVSLSPVRKSQSFLRDDSDFTVRRLSQAQVSSLSDDCSSDEFHSASVPGTPDTSRPQSEKGAPPVYSDIEQRLMSQGEARAQPHPHPHPHPHPQNSQSTIKEPVPNATQKIPTVVLDTSEAGRVTVVNAATSVLHMPQGRSIAQIRVPSEQGGGLPDMNFLPKLKHQPLKPAEKQTPASRQMARASPSPSKEKMLTNQQPWPASYLEEARKATPLAPPPQALRSPGLPPKASSRTPELSVRTHPSSSTISHSAASSGYATPSGDPVAKMFVECCGCKYYHDLPSNLYEVMANPDTVIPTRNTKVELSGLITMTVKCPWCNHEMNTKCCAGYLAMVYLKQKLH